LSLTGSQLKTREKREFYAFSVIRPRVSRNFRKVAIAAKISSKSSGATDIATWNEKQRRYSIATQKVAAPQVAVARASRYLRAWFCTPVKGVADIIIILEPNWDAKIHLSVCFIGPKIFALRRGLSQNQIFSLHMRRNWHNSTSGHISDPTNQLNDPQNLQSREIFALWQRTWPKISFSLRMRRNWHNSTSGHILDPINRLSNPENLYSHEIFALQQRMWLKIFLETFRVVKCSLCGKECGWKFHFACAET